MICLPYSKTKRYLTGIDWFFHALDSASKKASGVGNVSQIVLELKGYPSPTKLKGILEAFIRRYPVVTGKASRDYNLAPYWKIYRAVDVLPRLKIHNLGKDADFSQVIEALGNEVNIPFSSDREHLVFHLVCAKDRYFVAMTFDHRLLDARGAEAFLNRLQAENISPDEHHGDVSLTEPAHLCRWGNKFNAGKRTNKLFRQLAKNTPLAFSLPDFPKKKKFKFRVITFDKAQTSRVMERAYSQAGYLMAMPYLLAMTAQALQRIFVSRGVSKGDYIMPVSTDTRSAKKVQQEIFFNHVSFFMFRLSMNEVSRFPDILDSVKKQMYDQVQSGLPDDFKEASLLARILPLSVMRYLMGLSFLGQNGSFCSSHIGEALYNYPTFIEEEVLNIFHMPRPPIPPGLGIYFNQFQGRLNVTISYVDGLLSEEEVNGIVKDMWLHSCPK